MCWHEQAATLTAGDHRRLVADLIAGKIFSYTDATSFAVMDRLGLTHAFAFDRNFAQYGKIVVTP